MSFSKIFVVLVLLVFGVIGLVAMARGTSKSDRTVTSQENITEEAMAIDQQVRPLPTADQMDRFFTLSYSRFPVVETITYSSRVPWKQGSAWVEDYARHHHTSRHFIARSLNGGPDYDRQDVANGDRFNVFTEDSKVTFHLVVDTSRCRMWMYYWDEATDERVLVTTYEIGLGREDPSSESGLLTPWGTYELGDNVAVYRSNSTGIHNGEKIDMIKVFGTRWIPFGREIEGCTKPSRGLGLHACPWIESENKFVEDRSGLSTYESDGCIRLKTEDMEELFAVIITKPSTIYVVDDFFALKLPGKEVA